MITIQLPAKWCDDALARELEIGVEISRNKRYITMRMSKAELAEAISDADYYATTYGLDEDLLGLRRSAKAALKRLRDI